MGKKNLNPSEMKKFGMIQQKQKEYVALRLHAVGGDFNAAQLKKAAEVAEKFGRGQLHLSTRQGVEIHFVLRTDAEEARKELESAGIAMGASGALVRIITACPGEATCRWGIIETKAIAHDLDRKYFRQQMPYKFKFAVTGCPNNCAKASENDVGVMGGITPEWNASPCTDCGSCLAVCPVGALEKTDGNYVVDRSRCINCGVCTKSCPADAWTAVERGHILWLGGTMGKRPRMATRVPGLIQSKARLYEIVERAVALYRANGLAKERFGHTLDRLGIKKSLEEILKPS